MNNKLIIEFECDPVIKDEALEETIRHAFTDSAQIISIRRRYDFERQVYQEQCCVFGKMERLDLCQLVKDEIKIIVKEKIKKGGK